MDLREILSDATFSSGRIFITVIRSLMVVPIITKLIGTEEYGLWVSILALVSLFMTVGGLHLHGALIKYAAPDDRQPFTDTLVLTFVFSTATTLMFILSGIIFGSELYSFLNIPPDLFIAGGFLLGTQIMIKFAINIPRAMTRVKYYEIIRSIRLIVEAVVLGLSLYLTRNILIAIILLGLVDMLIAVILLVRFHLSVGFPAPEASNFEKYLRYGVPMVPKGISESVVSYTDRIVLLVLSGPAAAGIYAAGYGITKMLTRIGNTFNSTLYPNVTSSWDQGNSNKLSSFYQSYFRGYTLISIPAAFGMSVLSWELIRLVATASIANKGSIVVPVLALGFISQGLESSFTYPLAADEKTKKISLITFAVAFLNLVLNLILIPMIGLMGGAIATTVAFSIRLFYLIREVDKLFGFDLPWRSIANCSISSILMSLALVLIPITDWRLVLFLYPVIGVICYVLFIFLLREVTLEEVKQAKRMLEA